MPAPTVDVRHLVLLTALDEAGTLNAAARRLHLTPSALSQQLRELEERLGGPLFHRKWRRLGITPAGRRLTDAARSLLTELERAEGETRELLTGTKGTLRLATACHQSYRWLPSLLRDFSERCPGVEVTVVTEAGAHPTEWLATRRLDVALVTETPAADPRLRLEPLFRDELVAIVGRGHPWFGSRWVELSELAGQHLWADAGATAPETALGRALAAAGQQPPRKQTVLPLTGGVPLEMARANLGVAVAPLWSAEAELASRELAAVRLGREGVWLQWALAVRDEPPGPALERLLEALRQHHPRARGRASSRRSATRRRA